MSAPTLEVIAQRAAQLGYQARIDVGDTGRPMLTVWPAEPRHWFEVRLSIFAGAAGADSVIRSAQSNDAGALVRLAAEAEGLAVELMKEAA